MKHWLGALSVLVLLGGGRLGIVLPFAFASGAIAVCALIVRLPVGLGLRKPLLLLMGAVGLGVLVAPSPVVAAGRATVVFASVLAMLLIEQQLRSGTWWRWCCLTGIAATAALAVLGLGLSARLGINPNALGGTLACLIPWVAMAARMAWRSGSWLEALILIVVGLLALWSMWLAGSVTAWIALGWPLALVFCAGQPRTRPVVWTLAAATVAGTMVVWLGLWDGGPFQEVIAIRREVWTRALLMVGDMPWTGVGLDAFRDIVPVYAPATVVLLNGIAHAHNVWLQVVLDLGIVGAFAYGWVLAAGLRAWRLAQGTPWEVPAAGASGVVLAAHLFGSADGLMLGSRAGMLVWCGMGVLLAMPRLVASTGCNVSGGEYERSHEPGRYV